MFLTIADYYCRMFFVRKINPHTITGDKMTNKLDSALLGRSVISATARRRKELIELGFTDETTIKILSEGDSDRTAEDIVAQIMAENLTGCVFLQKTGHSGTSCDLITETDFLSKHRVEVKSAKQIADPNNCKYGTFNLQGIKPELFDIIFFVMFGMFGTSVEMMSKKQYVKHFGYENAISLRHTGITDWRPKRRNAAWCNHDRARHRYLQGREDVIQDCLADDFEARFNMCLSHKTRKNVCQLGCPA